MRAGSCGGICQRSQPAGIIRLAGLLPKRHNTQHAQYTPELFAGRRRQESVLRHLLDTTAIAPHDSVEQLQQLGVQVIRGDARFTGPRAVVVNGYEIHAHRVVITTGSEAFVARVLD